MIKGKFSIIVPAHKLFKRIDGKYELEACLDSILDQDYKHYEIIVAANGDDRKEIADFVNKKYPQVLVVETIEGNVCRARNDGQKVANGEFYTFFSSDFVMYPGCLSIWKEAFDENPEAVMVYSSYDLTTAGKYEGQRSMTFEFDRYKLECFNYIDGGFPVRASAYKPWDVNCKALNDWDWVLSLTDNGEKMKMIKDVTYSAEVPKGGGLSDYSHKNWQELKDYIQKKHGIKKHDWVVTSLGAPFHGERTAKNYGAAYIPMPSFKPHDYKMVYLLGYYIMNGSQAHHNNVFANANKDCARVIHWIGTDVLQMMHVEWIWNKNTVDALNEYMDLQLCECKHVQLELKEMGIDAKILPLPVETDKFEFIRIKPKVYTIAIYNPKGDASTHAKYQLAFCLQVAKSMPDIHFIFFGGGARPDDATPNCEFRGWVPCQEVARDSNAILRITPHDGLPMGVVEFLLQGRDAITSVPGIEGAYFRGNGDFGSDAWEEQLKRQIEQIRYVQKHPRSLKDRQRVSDYWRKELDPKRCKKKLEEYLEEARLKFKAKVRKFKKENKQ